MVGSGVASSLVHEVGHQGAAWLCLVESLREDIASKRRSMPVHRRAVWRWWERWISEIVADFWSVGELGITSTLGLIGVVSLPRAFVFRVGVDDPHPIPWIRVKLSAAIGDCLYPHPQWRQLAGDQTNDRCVVIVRYDMSLLPGSDPGVLDAYDKPSFGAMMDEWATEITRTLPSKHHA